MSSSSFRTFISNKRRENDKNSNGNNSRGDRSFKCRDCEGFGYYQSEYPHFLKRKKNSLVVTLSDDNLSTSSDEEEGGRAFIGCTLEDVNRIEGSSCSQERNVNHTVDFVEPDVSKQIFDQI